MSGRAPGGLLTYGALLLLTLIWGHTWAAIRLGLRGIPPLTGVSLRFAIAAAILFVVARALRIPLGRHPRERRLWLVNASLSFGVSYGVVYWAEQWVPSGLASILFATFPLFVAVLAHWSLPGEQLTARGAVGACMGFLGVAVIFSEDLSRLGGPRVAVAAAVMLLSPLASAVAQVVIKRWGSGCHPLSLTAVPMGLTAAVMGVLAFGLERSREISLDPVSVGALLYLSICGSAITFTVYFWLLSHLPATRLSLIAYAIPVVAVMVGTVFLDEPLTRRTLSGSALVVAGVAIAGGRRPEVSEELP